MTSLHRDEASERWQICDGCGQTWRLPKTPIVHQSNCSSDQWRQVMPVSEHDETERIRGRQLDDLLRTENQLERLREAAQTVVNSIRPGWSPSVDDLRAVLNRSEET